MTDHPYISNNPPHTILELTEGESQALRHMLMRRRADANRDFNMAKAAMMQAAHDHELCDQMIMKIEGRSTDGRYRFPTTLEQLEALRKQQEDEALTGAEG